MAICTRHPFLHIYKVCDHVLCPLAIEEDLVQELTKMEATLIISPRGVFQSAISGDLGAFVQRSQFDGLVPNATTINA